MGAPDRAAIVGGLVEGERTVLELIATGKPLAITLTTLCRVIDQHSGLVSSIFLMDAAGERLNFAAGPRLPQVWVDAVRSFPLTETACGAAITHRQRTITEDIENEPLYEKYRGAARAARLRAVWSTPFFDTSDRALGTFAVYSSQPGPPRGEDLQFVDCATRLASIAVERHTVEHELERSVAHARALTARLLRVQDDERRRLAQILHETTVQELAGLKMLLARLKQHLEPADHALAAESIDLAEHAISGLRTMSYLLYPPFLDDSGLLSAIRWYTEGFAARSGIAVSLDLPPQLPRMPRDVETAVFRVLQEALTNVHRHSQSATAAIAVRSGADGLTLQVSDTGSGMAPAMLSRVMANGAAGVGVATMRERLDQLGGHLDLTSDHTGTTLRANVPVVALDR